jgi:hypothetical protein
MLQYGRTAKTRASEPAAAAFAISLFTRAGREQHKLCSVWSLKHRPSTSRSALVTVITRNRPRPMSHGVPLFNSRRHLANISTGSKMKLAFRFPFFPRASTSGAFFA